jgi:Kef-type K+ transport system membrane component KefB
MKKIFIFTIIGLLTCAILIQSDVIDSLLMFIMVGAIPGTPYSVPPVLMLMIVFAVFWMVFFRMVVRPVARRHAAHRKSKKHATHRKRMPSRRFKRIEATS